MKNRKPVCTARNQSTHLTTPTIVAHFTDENPDEPEAPCQHHHQDVADEAQASVSVVHSLLQFVEGQKMRRLEAGRLLPGSSWLDCYLLI